MATFISRIKFTQQGTKDMAHTTRRAAPFKAPAKNLGVKWQGMDWMLGDHDGVMVLDAPDDKTATAALLQFGAPGNIDTTTCRAFTAGERDGILAKRRGG